jgi:hypothetical protein
MWQIIVAAAVPHKPSVLQCSDAKNNAFDPCPAQQRQLTSLPRRHPNQISVSFWGASLLSYIAALSVRLACCPFLCPGRISVSPVMQRFAALVGLLALLLTANGARQAAELATWLKEGSEAEGKSCSQHVCVMAFKWWLRAPWCLLFCVFIPCIFVQATFGRCS